MNKLVSAKNFVLKHERAFLITTAVVGIAGTVLMKNGLKQHDAFLKEHNLFEEYYTPENSY